MYLNHFRRAYLYNRFFGVIRCVKSLSIQKMKRLGFVGIIIEDREKCAGIVNAVLSDFSDLILARTGLPNVKDNASVITLVIDADTDELGKLTGKLGTISGVSVKSGLAKK